MNLILLSEEDFLQEGKAHLTGERAEHVIHTIRAKVGDTLTVGLIDNLLGCGIVAALTSNTVILNVTLNSPPPAPLPLRLILALPRPKVLRRTIAACAALGAKDLILLNSYRVEKSYWGSPLLEADELKKHLILGLEQGKDTQLPTIRLEKRFKPFVEDELPLLVDNSTALVAHPYADSLCPKNSSGHITLAVGPEGGFIPYEIEKLTETGFQSITLGQRVLKVETAIPFLLGKLF